MLKKIMSLICAIVMVLAVAGCTNDNQPTVNFGNSSKDDTTSQNSSNSDDTSSGNSSDKNNVSYYDNAEEGGNAWSEVDNSSITSSGGNNVTTAKEFDLKSVKQLVFPKYNSSYLTTLALQELQATYKSKAKLDLKIVKDNAGTKDYELLVGRTSRTSTSRITDVDSYVICWKGNKLIVDGGSPKAINTAIALLSDKISNGEYIIKKAINGKCKKSVSTVGEYTETLTDDFDGVILSNMWRGVVNQHISTSNNGLFKTVGKSRSGDLCTLKGGKLYQKVTLDSVTKEGNVTVRNVSYPKIDTKNLFWYRFGYIEASMKVSTGEGVGSNFWVHGNNTEVVGDVYCEFDIFEMHGNPRYLTRGALAWEIIADSSSSIGSKSRSSLYLDTANNTGKEYRQEGLFSLENLEIFGNEYHTFGLEWDENYYNYTVDGVIVKSVKYTDMPENFETKKYITKQKMIEIFREPVYPIFDMYIGRYTWEDLSDGIPDIENNNWVNDNICAIDYMTVYQKSGQLSGSSFSEVKQQMQ